MKKLFLIILVFLSLSLCSAFSKKPIKVRGYFKKNGTYVSPYYRSAPDKSVKNNWSTKGNINPITHKYGTRIIYSSSSSSYSYDMNNNQYINNKTDTYLDKIIEKLNNEQNNVTVIFSDRPQNTIRNKDNTKWICAEGYKNYINKCIYLKLPENAVENKNIFEWKCKKGFYQKNNTCLKLVVPENAILTAYGDDWICKRGYSKSNNICNHIDLPENSELNFIGDDWVCMEGYSKTKDYCIKL